MRMFRRIGEKQTHSLTLGARIGARDCRIVEKQTHLLTLGARMGARGQIGAPSVSEWVFPKHSGALPWR
jgi:hypothetical protein